MVKKVCKKKEQLIVINVGMSVFDKIKILDDYYLWLFENEYDGSLAQVLTRYKYILMEAEKRKNKKTRKDPSFF